MAVKVCLKPHTDEVDMASAREQHDTLLRVHRAMGGELSVPRPCLLSAELGLVATEWIPGKTISSLLFSWAAGTGRATQLLERAARWLRAFHRCRPLPAGQLDIVQAVAFLATLESSTQTAGEPLFRAAIRQLRTSALAAGAVTLERSWVHGDFTCDNVMVSGNRTLGIDIEVRYENPVIYDLAPFLNHLELRSLHPSGWRRAMSVQRSCETFLRAYLGREPGAMLLPLAWLRLYMLLQGWATAQKKPRPALASWFVETSYKSVVRRLAWYLEHSTA